MWNGMDQASVYFGCSRRTLERRIDANKVESRMQGGRRVVRCADTDAPDTGSTILALERQIATSQERIDQLTDKVVEMADKMSDERHRADEMMMIKERQVLELTRTNQALLETSNQTIWHRLKTLFQ